jgi:3-deoxy-D-manno-octulosonic-acid transferase
MLLKTKYRRRIPARLGLGGLTKMANVVPAKGQYTYWVHALSVGEITSALPLVTGLRKTYPDCRIIVTAATETGEAVARDLLSHLADCILASPIDLLPTVSRYIRTIQPDIFIQIETDFWPNLLTSLRRNNVPAILVNGRISQKSLNSYRKLDIFFLPMFQSFSHMCMQTEADKENMQALGIPSEKLHTLGNLKYDTPGVASDSRTTLSCFFPENRLILVAGSTHEGEEQILYSCYKTILLNHPHLYLVIVPRNPKRSEQLLLQAESFGLHGVKRSQNPEHHGDFLIVDTIGELVECYRHCAIAFVGGSLVPEGGHNPIEPAIMQLPVIFGLHMEDFHEISHDLITAGGAVMVTDETQLRATLEQLIRDSDLRKRMGLAAETCIKAQQGVITRHIELIHSLL